MNKVDRYIKSGFLGYLDNVARDNREYRNQKRQALGNKSFY